MRLPHILLIVLLLAASPSAHAGLVAHYRFDGDLKDATGRHDGRPVDATLAPAFAPGRAGSAVVIERANAGIEGLQVHGEGQGEWITNFRASNGLVPNDGQWHHVAVTYRAAQAPHFTLYVDGRRTTTEIGLRRGLRAEEKIVLSAPAFASDRDVVQVSLRNGQGRELWHKTIRAMIVREAPELPAFGATETKLRYDYPLLSYSGPDEVTEIPYDQAWAAERKDVVVALPNGSRFVFWRGAAYTPFWAGKHNTALNFEFAEAPTRKDGVDCVDASSDKELRRSRVEIRYSNTRTVVTGPDRFLVLYTDFKYGGQRRKAIVVQELIVSAKD